MRLQNAERSAMHLRGVDVFTVRDGKVAANWLRRRDEELVMFITDTRSV
jgi:hypothetical protein